MKKPRVKNRDDIRIPGPCGHPGCAMKVVEVQGREAAALALADPDLARVCGQVPPFAGRRSPDFYSLRHVVEVKELTSEPLRGFNGAFDERNRHTPIPDFEHVWSVMVEVSDGAAVYKGDPEMPQLNTLIATLTPMIKDLEKREIIDAFHDHDNFGRWTKVIGHYGICAVADDTELDPGILLTGTISGQPRTMDLDCDVIAPLEYWLTTASDQIDNVRDSLAGYREVRVLVLLASPSGPASRLIHALMQTPDEVPSASLQLPENVDVLVIATNTDVLRFEPADGWRRHNLQRL